MMALTKGLHLPAEEPHWNVAMALRRPFFEDPRTMRSFMGTTKRSAVLAVLLCTSELGVTWSKCDDCEWCSFVDPPTRPWVV